MREILYRGKKVDNSEWVAGYLNGWVTDNKQVYAIITPEEVCIVIPETVGQYTGINDKNNKEIFEGDVLKHSSEVVKIVVYNSDNACFEMVFPNRVGFKDNLRYFTEREGEIIGNIHDNKELLNG